jgi:predicted AAA+ superfamily ATPase
MSKKENIKSFIKRENKEIIGLVYVFNMVDTEADKMAYVSNTLVFKKREDAIKAMKDAIDNDLREEIVNSDELFFEDDDTAYTDRMYYTVRQKMILG